MLNKFYSFSSYVINSVVVSPDSLSPTVSPGPLTQSVSPSPSGQSLSPSGV